MDATVQREPWMSDEGFAGAKRAESLRRKAAILHAVNRRHNLTGVLKLLVAIMVATGLGALTRGMAFLEPWSHWTQAERIDDALRGVSLVGGFWAACACALTLGYLAVVLACKVADLGRLVEAFAQRALVGIEVKEVDRSQQ